jgi:hypothetical protein
MTKPYTYLIGWPDHNLWYYGVRYARNCDPSDLWRTYFTSSIHVARKRLELGEPPLVQIRRTFSDHSAARKWERRVLQRMHVRDDQRFINRTDNKAFPPEKHPDHIEAVAEKLRGKKRTPEQRANISAGRKGTGRAPKSAATRRKMSEAARQRPPRTEEHRRNMGAAMKLRVQGEGERAKRKASLTGKKKSPEHIKAVVEAKRKKALERALLAAS